MKFRLPSFKIPSWKIPSVKLPKFQFKKFQFNWNRTVQLVRAWKKFLRQIPPSYRHFIQSYPRHFIVIGDQGSGKSQLIQKFIDQERDIYSFETFYTDDPDIQFYMGQRCILQEVSWSLTENRSILAKKQLTNIWKKLYSYRNPTFVVTFNPIKWKELDSEKINHYARLMINKIALLSNLIDKPIEVRIAVTHMDMIEGYAAFNRVLQMKGISLDFDLAHYDTNKLQEAFKAYEEYIPLVMKNASAEDYLKVLNFMKELSSLSVCIDQFVRSLTQKEYEKKILQLEKGYFLSNQESDIGSDVFDCVQELTPSVYIKRHYLKHRLASASVAALGIALLGGYVVHKKQELQDVRSKVAFLERQQKQECLVDVLPHIGILKAFSDSSPLISKLQLFYYKHFHQQIKDFVAYSRENILQPTFRKMVLNNQSEVEMMYFLSLAKATNNNRFGQLINENMHEWVELLNLPEEFIKLYTQLASTPQASNLYVEEFNSLYTNTPFSDATLWFRFFQQMQDILEAPHTLETYLPDLQTQADVLLKALEKLDNYPYSSHLCKMLMADEELSQHKQFLPKIELIRELRTNSEMLTELLTMVKSHSIKTPSFSHQSVKNFLNSLDQLLLANEGENSSFHFILGGRRWQFESEQWCNLLVEPKIKKIVEDYLVKNRDIGLKVFFKNNPELIDLNFSYLSEYFPALKNNATIPSYYTRSAYERDVFSIAEKMTKLNQSRLISPEVKTDLSQFIAQRVELYAREYRRQYENILNQIDVKPTSFAEAEAVINLMTTPLSPYAHFLHAFRTNLNLPSSDSLVLYAIGSQLADLNFIHRLLPEELDQPGEMHAYQAMLRSLLLDSRGTSTGEALEGCGILNHYLTPLSQMSLNILTKRSSSYLGNLKEWLMEVEVPTKFHSFFMNPVIWVHEFGLRELEVSIKEAWRIECEPQVTQLLSKFPFHPDASEHVTIEELEGMMHPNSSLWKKVHEIVGVACEIHGETWEAIQPDQFKLDPELLLTVNHFAHATNMLWDSKGDPQPLCFKIQTVPFTGEEDHGGKVVLSHLSTPHQIIFNANQMPQTNKLEIFWWQPEEILFGFELIETQTGFRRIRGDKVDAAEWNIFQMLKKGVQRDTHTWCWTIPDVESEPFSLYFEKNPWEIFKPLLGVINE